MNEKTLAAKIVEALHSDLYDRNGFDHWWDDIDAETRAEILRELEALVEKVLKESAT